MLFNTPKKFGRSYKDIFFYISLKNDKNSLKKLKIGCLRSIFSNRMDTKYQHDEELEILHDFHLYLSDLSPKVLSQ